MEAWASKAVLSGTQRAKPARGSYGTTPSPVSLKEGPGQKQAKNPRGVGEGEAAQRSEASASARPAPGMCKRPAVGRGLLRLCRTGLAARKGSRFESGTLDQIAVRMKAGGRP